MKGKLKRDTEKCLTSQSKVYLKCVSNVFCKFGIWQFARKQGKSSETYDHLFSHEMGQLLYFCNHTCYVCPWLMKLCTVIGDVHKRKLVKFLVATARVAMVTNEYLKTSYLAYYGHYSVRGQV